MGFKFRSYKVSSLHLDIANPRMRRATTEASAQEKLLDGYGDSIVALGRDIAQFGLSPLEQWAVVREGGKLIVLEGNRRLTACRLLLDPTRTTNASIRRRFQGIRVEVPDERFTTASCALFDARAEARHWIELKHHGAGGGVGVAQWGPEMVYLHHRAQGGKRAAWNELWILLEDFFATDADVMEVLEPAREAQYTLLERLVDAGLLDYLDLSWQHGNLEGMIGSRGRALMLAILSEMRRNGELSSRSINSVKEARSYIEEKAAALPDDDMAQDDADSDSTEDEPDAESGEAGNSNEGETAGGQDEARGGGQGSKGRSGRSRSTVYLLRGVRFRPFGGRIPRLAEQAQRLKFNGADELCGVTLRVLLDLCTEVYWKALMAGEVERRLSQRVQRIILHLDPSHEQLKPGMPELRAAWAYSRTDATDAGKLIYALNDYVHNTEVSGQGPLAGALSDGFGPLFSAMAAALQVADASGGRGASSQAD